ncbi:MAG: OsmC family peroxiredoxin [Candidatus Eisenbacteria bacterium]|nr:OsmC family peroxiredoxin [Candidatus Latescibacterota bacterium]MBD3301889.1 OsmC family peroxiredoxin [Candidatus Eisenbacteria bacterium]
MPISKSSAEWKGNLKEGTGTMRAGDGACEVAYTAGTRFEGANGSNPEELIGAAHAGCFSMAFAARVEKAGHDPRRVSTTADVHLEKTASGFEIRKIELTTEAEIPGIDEETFQKLANEAKEGCPVSRALAGPSIGLTAKRIQ